MWKIECSLEKWRLNITEFLALSLKISFATARAINWRYQISRFEHDNNLSYTGGKEKRFGIFNFFPSFLLFLRSLMDALLVVL